MNRRGFLGALAALAAAPAAALKLAQAEPAPPVLPPRSSGFGFRMSKELVEDMQKSPGNFVAGTPLVWDAATGTLRAMTSPDDLIFGFATGAQPDGTTLWATGRK